MDLQTEPSLFNACVELPAREREAGLAHHCAEPALREGLERLLRAHDDAEAHGALQSPVPASLQDQHIGPYRLLKRIGEGAMGEVYLAERRTPVLRRVAPKGIGPAPVS